MEMPASACMPVSASVNVAAPSARWHRFQPHAPRTLTVGAGFVNKVTEVEEGGPGGQVLNEPLMGGGEQSGTVSVIQSVCQPSFVKSLLDPIRREMGPEAAVPRCRGRTCDGW